VTFDRTDVLLIFIVTFFSFWTRFWLISMPSSVVFDEVHFGSFTNWYILSEFFYDIHPPLGKLIMFLMANLSEYDAGIDFEHRYGSSYPSEAYVTLRHTPAFFSSLCMPLIYLAVRFDSFNPTSALLASFMVGCDSSLLTEHRYILSDGMLHFFCCLFLAVYSYVHSLESYSHLGYIIAGLLLGGACSCKNTAWGLLPFTGAVETIIIFQHFARFSRDFCLAFLTRGFSLAVPAFLVYVGSFFIHFIVLPFSGQGTGFLSPEMQQQLLTKSGGDLWYKRVSEPGLLYRTAALAIDMHKGNMGLVQYHPYQSRPINWPLLTGISVSFWGGVGGTEVACRGNAIVYGLVVLGLVAIACGFRMPKWDIGLRYALGWSFCYFPFFLIPRSMYLYHYLVPLIIGCMATGASLDMYCSKYWAGFASFVGCALAFAGFLLWSPFSYGTAPYDPKYTIWTDRWLHGDAYHKNLSRHRR
jgi:dolichyl-phosphate-mannose--protein O-mannosyl transferase